MWCYNRHMMWGVSAAGSASDWQSGGHEFEPRTLHHGSAIKHFLFLCPIQSVCYYKNMISRELTTSE